MVLTEQERQQLRTNFMYYYLQNPRLATQAAVDQQYWLQLFEFLLQEYLLQTAVAAADLPGKLQRHCFFLTYRIAASENDQFELEEDALAFLKPKFAGEYCRMTRLARALEQYCGYTLTESERLLLAVYSQLCGLPPEKMFFIGGDSAVS